jgi:catechol 2,3-dioxygenase-like lactoylglutathione lyase family enzyme
VHDEPGTPAPKIQGIVELGVYADDLELAEQFYGKLLGLEQIGKEAGRHVFFAVGSGVLLVFNAASTLKGDILPAHGARGPGHFALGIAAEAWEFWRERLQAHGIKIEKEITWPRGGKSMYFRDPAGNSVELITPGVWGVPSGW